MPSLVGPQGQLYADPTPSPDEIKFREDNTSSAYYNSPYFTAHKNQVQKIPARRTGVPLDQPLNLSDFVPQQIINAISQAGKIVFHTVGDTGAAKVTRSQTAGTAIGHEAAVADAMSKDVQTGGPSGPAFFFHLGDVIYNFGEAQYYYDQFYEPFRAYDRPIFAIPGNHDGMVFGQGSSAPQVPTLDAFLTNFCGAGPGPSPDSGGLIRGVMTQPGVYFTVDAPFVSIIGLYSNVLDSGPGVISSQSGNYPIVDDQLTFLKGELARLKKDREANKRAVILALHHPPLSADAKHGGSLGLIKDIDSCCKAAGLWPDVVLSGHAHLYQRFTRVVNGKQTPYIVSGSGGFAATGVKTLPPAPIKVGDHTLEIDPIISFGYITVETDGRTISLVFKTADAAGTSVKDSVLVDLKTGTLILSSGAGMPPAKATKPTAKVRKKASARRRSRG